MSEKSARKDREIKLMTEEAGIKKTADEMASSIRKMYEDRDAKALGARDKLASQLEVTAAKYLTVNGVLAALDSVRDVYGSDTPLLAIALEIAKESAVHLSSVAADLANKVKATNPEDMEGILEGVYDENFANSDATPKDTVLQLMLIQLCQNVGPAAQDIVSFLSNTDAEIEKAQDDLRKFCDEHGIDFHKLCNEE